MATSVERDEVLAAIGCAVLASQPLEALMRMCMTFVFQGDTPLTLESLTAQEARERRKTIGYFVGKLKARVGVRADFGELLMSFLERRNQLIHRASEVQGWDLEDAAGRRIAKAFADQVCLDANQLVMIFAGFVRAWQLQTGMTAVPPGGAELMAEIDKSYAPLINYLVHEKDAQE